MGKQPPNNYFKKGGFLSGIEEELKDFKEGEAVRFSYSYQSPDGKIHNAQGFILPALDLVNKDVELVYYSKVPKTSVTEGQEPLQIMQHFSTTMLRRRNRTVGLASGEY